MDYLIIILNAPKRTRACCESLSGESGVAGTLGGRLSGDLPNPGIKPGLLHCRWILYHLSYQGSASIGEAGVVPICIIDEEVKSQGALET